MEGTRPLRGLP